MEFTKIDTVFADEVQAEDVIYAQDGKEWDHYLVTGVDDDGDTLTFTVECLTRTDADDAIIALPLHRFDLYEAS